MARVCRYCRPSSLLRRKRLIIIAMLIVSSYGYALTMLLVSMGANTSRLPYSATRSAAVRWRSPQQQVARVSPKPTEEETPRHFPLALESAAGEMPIHGKDGGCFDGPHEGNSLPFRKDRARNDMIAFRTLLQAQSECSSRADCSGITEHSPLDNLWPVPPDLRHWPAIYSLWLHTTTSDGKPWRGHAHLKATPPTEECGQWILPRSWLLIRGAATNCTDTGAFPYNR